MPSIIISSISESKGKSALAAGIISRLRYDGVSVTSTAETGRLFSDDNGVGQVMADQIEPSGATVSIIEGSSGDPESDFDLAEQFDASVVLVASLDEDVEVSRRGFG